MPTIFDVRPQIAPGVHSNPATLPSTVTTSARASGASRGSATPSATAPVSVRTGVASAARATLSGTGSLTARAGATSAARAKLYGTGNLSARTGAVGATRAPVSAATSFAVGTAAVSTARATLSGTTSAVVRTAAVATAKIGSTFGNLVNSFARTAGSAVARTTVAVATGVLGRTIGAAASRAKMSGTTSASGRTQGDSSSLVAVTASTSVPALARGASKALMGGGLFAFAFTRTVAASTSRVITSVTTTVAARSSGAAQARAPLSGAINASTRTTSVTWGRAAQIAAGYINQPVSTIGRSAARFAYTAGPLVIQAVINAVQQRNAPPPRPTIAKRLQTPRSAFQPLPQPIMSGGGGTYTLKEVERLTKATQQLLLSSAQEASEPPPSPIDGMVRLARNPWWPVAGQVKDAWVYYDGALQAWQYLDQRAVNVAETYATSLAATATPLADTPSGTVGSSGLYARQDHTHPILAAAPGGRLTFSTDPRPGAVNSEGVQAINYVQYMHNYVPIWNGTSYAMTPLPSGGLTNSYTDATTNPAAVVAWCCYDMFIWNKSGTLTLTRSPSWGAVGTRVAPVMQNGFLVNSTAITNGPAAGYGTYVGTIGTYSTVSYQRLGAGYPGTAPNDALCHLWNQYNRIAVGVTVGTQGQGSYPASGTAAANGWYPTAQRVWVVTGDTVPFSAAFSLDNGTAGSYWGTAYGMNPTNGGGSFSWHLGLTGPNSGGWLPSSGNWLLVPGQTVLAVESNTANANNASMWAPLCITYEC